MRYAHYAVNKKMCDTHIFLARHPERCGRLANRVGGSRYPQTSIDTRPLITSGSRCSSFVLDSLAENLFLSLLAWEKELAIHHQIAKKYATRNEQIVADLRNSAGAAPPVDPAMVAKRKVAQAAIALALSEGGSGGFNLSRRMAL